MSKSVEEIVKEEIAYEIKLTIASIAQQEYQLEETKKQLERLRKEEACDGHTFESLGGGMESITEVCTKCGRYYSY
jgi:hypothetical protein